MKYGYARVSTEAQDLTGSTAQLKAAGCQKIYREKRFCECNRRRLGSLLSARVCQLLPELGLSSAYVGTALMFLTYGVTLGW